MLIPTRNQNESIIINDDIKITVVSDRHGQVKLGIEAPEDVEIWREELLAQQEETAKRLARFRRVCEKPESN